jgi:hypothetical protein
MLLAQTTIPGWAASRRLETAISQWPSPAWTRRISLRDCPPDLHWIFDRFSALRFPGLIHLPALKMEQAL